MKPELIFKDFRYILGYFSLPKKISQKLGDRGIIFDNNMSLYCNSKHIDIFDTIDVDKRAHKFKYSVLEAIHIFCLEL